MTLEGEKREKSQKIHTFWIKNRFLFDSGALQMIIKIVAFQYLYYNKNSFSFLFNR